MIPSNAELREAAERYAAAGGRSTLNHFKKTFQLEYKEDDSPVTNADREAETVIREMIRSDFPGHGIIGEEYGKENEDSDVVWILDPIDGTKSFIHGVPFYTTLIGVLVKDEPVAGIIYAPALDELVSAATGEGCTLNGEECRVRECDSLAKATFLTTEVDTFEKYGFRAPFSELLNRTRLHRTWGDAYGHMMVATGRADIMIDPILNIWDAAALLPVITEAGGAHTDLKGKKTIQTGNGLSTNKTLLPEILNIFDQD
ncbi:MAG: histidinol-phosphatase [Balneolaceae bacterium]|nr:histidinol-phosphatase [Balneolaceae bacterium]MCH8549240.1 histidinol-phosphatase [Balneolaceae bacterium]